MQSASQHVVSGMTASSSRFTYTLKVRQTPAWPQTAWQPSTVSRLSSQCQQASDIQVQCTLAWTSITLYCSGGQKWKLPVLPICTQTTLEPLCPSAAPNCKQKRCHKTEYKPALCWRLALFTFATKFLPKTWLCKLSLLKPKLTRGQGWHRQLNHTRQLLSSSGTQIT